MQVDPMSIVGGGIGIANSLVNAIKGIKQVKDGKKIQEKLDVQGHPILETPDAFNEIEGLVRSNYLDPRLTGETRIKDSIKAREANKIQTIQDTASSGADALFAYGLANANTDNSLFNVDMKAYEQQQNDYNKLLSTLGQKANYEEKQFDFNVVQPFMQSAEQAKALIAAGEQNRNNAFENKAGYASSLTKKPTVVPPTVAPPTVAPPTVAPPTVVPPTVVPPTVVPPTVVPPTETPIPPDPTATLYNSIINGNTTNTEDQLNGQNMSQLKQLQQLLQLLNNNPSLVG
jgi:hypothetical protein